MTTRVFALTVIVMLAAATGCQQSQTLSDDPQENPDTKTGEMVGQDQKQIALKVKDELFTRLSGRLMEAMSKGGPVAAIEVCSLEAPKIAKAVSEEQGVKIGRTSFKLRNLKNSPPEWAKPIVEKRTDEPTYVDLDDGRLGAMLPIHLKSQCLTCHGNKENIADDVKAVLAKRYPDDQATGFAEGDLRGWFWVEVPAEASSQPVTGNNTEDNSEVVADDHRGRGMMGRGPGMGRGMMGRGPGGGMREDMSTIHAMFDSRDKITRTVKNLANGAETLTESKDERIASLIQEHVPAMEGRVEGNNPLPPMTFHPLFIELIKHADKITMNYDTTEHGMKVTYTSDDPFVVLLIQEHAKLVSRFVKNGMGEIHKPYTIPKPESSKQSSAKDLLPNDDTNGVWQALPRMAESPDDNPTTAAKVELGKKLFFDPRLSLTGTVSCNSCHNLMEGGDDGRPTSMGIHGRLGPRNAPTVWNSVFQTSQFWDGRVASLEEQAAGPIVAQPEMGMPNHDVAVDRIKAIPGYVSEFHEVFGQDQQVTIDRVVKAIAAFERTLITPNSPYDRYVQGEETAMSEQEIRGMNLFDSVGCTECHSGPNFNNWEPNATAVAFEQFPRSSDSPLVAKYSLDRDLGRYEATKNDADKHLFKTPTLRNITLTAPYFHNGAVPTLREAIQVMSVTQLEAELTSKELDEIMAFLSALEGKFPEITLPHIPSRSGHSAIDDAPAATVDAINKSSQPAN